MRRDGEGTVIRLERGDVVWGIDPFKSNAPDPGGPRGSEGPNGPLVRPWLVISTDAVPFHPEQYLCVTLTTRAWHDDAVPIPKSNWEVGGAPGATSVLPWSVSAIKHQFLDTTGECGGMDESPPDDPPPGFQGSIATEVVDRVTRQLVAYLEGTLVT